jgi:hypothetical protein
LALALIWALKNLLEEKLGKNILDIHMGYKTQNDLLKRCSSTPLLFNLGRELHADSQDVSFADFY